MSWRRLFLAFVWALQCLVVVSGASAVVLGYTAAADARFGVAPLGRSAAYGYDSALNSAQSLSSSAAGVSNGRSNESATPPSPRLNPPSIGASVVAAETDASGSGAGDSSPEGEPECEVANGGQSFSDDSLVLLANGTEVPISQVRRNDKVEATNTTTGNMEPEVVSAVLINRDTNLYDLTIASGGTSSVIQTTSSHLFWDTTRNAWTVASALRQGDHLRTSDGGMATVEEGGVPTITVGSMWDLTVANDDDFYVDDVLVHNDNTINLSNGYNGRTDQFNMGQGTDFEIHVYDSSGQEVGIFGSNGWFPKHGLGDDVDVPEGVSIRLKGEAIDTMRAEGRLGPKGTEDVTGDNWMRARLGGGC